MRAAITSLPLLPILACFAIAGCKAKSKRPAKEDVLARHEAALGGAEALAKDLYLFGTYQKGPETGRIRILIQREPFGYREEWLPLRGGGRIAVSDGRYAWRPTPLALLAMPASMTRRLDSALKGDAARAILDHAFIEGRLYLDHKRILGHWGVDDSRILPDRKGLPDSFEKKVAVHTLHFFTPAGSLLQLHFDAKDGRLHEVEDPEVSGRWMRFGAWQTFDGLRIPTMRVAGTRGVAQVNVLRIDVAKAGVTHPVAFFKGHPLPPSASRRDGGPLRVLAQTIPGAGALVLPAARVNGRASGPMLLDTGARDCTVTPALARRLGLLRGGRRVHTTLSNKQQAYSRWVDRLEFGTRRVLQFPAACLDLPNLPQLAPDRQPSLVLGGAELTEGSPVLDLTAGRLRFRDTPVTPLDGTAIEIPFRSGRNDPTAIHVEIEVHGTTLEALLDTGMDTTLRLTRAALERTGLPTTRAAWIQRGAHPLPVVAAGGHESLDLIVTLDSFRLGPITFQKPVVRIADPDTGADDYPGRPFVALVGCGALLPFARVGIDRQRHVLELGPGDTVQRTPEGRLTVPSPGRFLGVILATPPSGAHSPPASLPAILEVCPGSPAALAQIEPGERVIAIGKRSCDGMQASEANRLLWLAAGHSIMLRLRKASGETHVVELR